MKRLAFIVLLAVSFIAGCSKKAPTGTGEEMMNGSPQSQAYGMSSEGGFADQGGTGGAAIAGRHVNSLTAPSNQVYYFEYDQADILASDMQAMNVQATYLAAHPSAHIRLEGNTDNRGSREYNVGLGWHRAQAVAQELEQQGVSPQQISMVSYGKEHPAAFGNDEQSWSLNRRVELIYENQ